MRKIFLLMFLIYSVCSFSQTIVKGAVRDSKTKEYLPYCNVVIKGTNRGVITNSDGAFSISVDITKDIIVFIFLGYETYTISAEKLNQKKEIFLIKKEFKLNEIIIKADVDFLYDILEKCKKKLSQNKTDHITKVYYGLETQSKERQVELVECFYNANVKGTNVDELLFKNGRTGLAKMDGNYFVTLSSSKAICQLNLLNKNNYFPTIPLQLNKKGMKKTFILEMGTYDSKIFNLKFKPNTNNSNCFNGEIWIEKETFKLLKINLFVNKTDKHPFIPIYPGDSITNVSFDISNTYKLENDDIVPDHINFNYHFNYYSCRDTNVVLYRKFLKRDITSKGIMYFYDYKNPFIIPYFEYNNDFDDYRKMSLIPYNEVFWDNNNPVQLTQKQNETIKLFAQEGDLINFRKGNYGGDFLILPKVVNNQGHDFFEYYYSFWTKDKRILLNKKLLQNEVYSQEKINQSIQSDLYKLKVQILLDITQLGDSIDCKSYTVFDADQTYFHLPEQSYTYAFLNIYFDICEIERRKMDEKLKSNHYSISQIDSIYKVTLENIDKITNSYLKEVEAGKDEKSLNKWNNYVFENLKINNIEIFNK